MPYSDGIAISVPAIRLHTTTPPASGDRPLRANAPTTTASMGRMVIAMVKAPVAGSAARTAAIAPYHGPNRMAMGSVATRPSSSGAAEPTRHRLSSIPATPQKSARPRRLATRVMRRSPAPASPPAAPIVYSRVVRVVIAEDDRVTGEILARTLQRWNHETTLVGDGVDAWERLRTANEP